LVLINAVGILSDNPDEIVRPDNLSPQELNRLAFHNPALRPDPAALSAEQLAQTAADVRALMAYAGEPYMNDPKLRRRPHRVTIPALVLWGHYDGLFPITYGPAYAASFSNAEFQPIGEAGHMPHLEQPELVLRAIDHFVSDTLSTLVTSTTTIMPGSP
jgi:pimeloyl-ACP methyl ester carboxylesterase